jgi:NADPH:quinone reductase
VKLSFFASAFEFGTSSSPLSGIPLQSIVDSVQSGAYRAKPARVFPFEGIVDAHRLMESHGVAGKLVARTD